MRKRFALAAVAATAAIAAAPPPYAAAPPPSPESIVGSYARSVDRVEMQRSVSALVGFGTRHTLSSQTSPRRGIGAALGWTERRFKSFGLATARPCDTVSGKRVPEPTRVCDMIAIQRGTERPNDVVIITGHIDSRVSDVMDAARDAPGANDDASGTAAVIEAARILSRHKFPGTIVYAALSGEEQGLLGGKILADYATAQGWNVIANLNNDIIGNSCGSDRLCDAKTVRVFSEGPRWQGRDQLAAQIRSLGGENDAPSRNLSRFLDRLAERLPNDIGIDVMQVWRSDRFGRGGDHTEFLNAGFPAVRLTEAVENYNQQHQDLRVEKGIEYGDTIDKMDFAYLARVTRLNVAALAWLANAPPPPAPTAEGAVSTDTTVRWAPVGGAASYRVQWRRTDASQWQASRAAPFTADQQSAMVAACLAKAPAGIIVDCAVDSIAQLLTGVRVDDWVFGVSAVSQAGFESPVAAAVPGGAFKPYTGKSVP